MKKILLLLALALPLLGQGVKELDGTPAEYARPQTAEISQLRGQNLQLQREIMQLQRQNAVLRDQLADMPPPRPPTPRHPAAKPDEDGSVVILGEVVQIVPDGVIVMAHPDETQYVITGHPNQAMLYDNQSVYVRGVQTGVYKLGDTTIGRFRVTSIIKYNETMGIIISEAPVPPPSPTPTSPIPGQGNPLPQGPEGGRK